jgi:hypothetical protein
MLPVFLVDIGIVSVLVGLFSVFKPLSFLRIRSRRIGALVGGFGLLVTAAGMYFPVGEVRVATPKTRLDEFAPVYQFREFHSIRVNAPREQTYRALQEVTAAEIRFYRTLTWIRRFGRPGPESILQAPEQIPILEIATRTSFLRLAEDPGREIVIGSAVAVPRGFRPKTKPTPEDFKAVRQPGFALASMNFLMQDDGPGACIVTTETRVYATDTATTRRFALYWRVIYPGSALIRREWLRAIKRRTEAAHLD